MTDDELADEYREAADRLTFLTSEANGAVRDRIAQLEEENQQLKTRLGKFEEEQVHIIELLAKQTAKIGKTARPRRS